MEGRCAYILGLFGAVVAGVSLRHARWELGPNPFCLGKDGGGNKFSSPSLVEADWRCCSGSSSWVCAPSEYAERWLIMAVLAMPEC